MDKLILVDGSGYIFRAFYALPMMNRSDGLPVNAVYGFTRMLLNIIENEQSLPGNESLSVGIGVIFDSKRHNFRNELYAAYKANRKEPPTELVPQFDWIKKVPAAFNLVAIEKEGFEADDLIATYARQAQAQGVSVVIYSSDKDLMQLVGNGLTLFDPVKNREIGVQEVQDKFGVPPEKVLDVMALCGDSSDNIPGVPGIGVKTAAELINQFGHLEALLEQAAQAVRQPKRRQSLIDYAEQARLSRQLACLQDKVEGIEPFSVFVFRPLQRERLLDFLRQLEFKRLIAEVQERFHSKTPSSPQGEQSCFDFADEKKDKQAYQSDTASNQKDLDTWLERVHSQGTCSLLWHEDETDGGGIVMAVDSDEGRELPASVLTLQGKPADWLTHLQALFADETILKIVHDMKAWRARMGNIKTMRCFEDVMLLAYVAEGGHLRHDWQSLWQRLQLSLGLEERTAIDGQCIGLHAMYHHLRVLAIERSVYSLYRYCEHPLVDVLLRMEESGVCVDRDFLAHLSRDFAKRQKDLETRIFRAVGHEFLLASSQQLAQVLFDELQLPAGKKGKSGVYSTDSGVLEDLARQGHGIADDILAWRRLAKLRNTYSEALPRYIDSSGRVHSHFAQTVANTGRLSSQEPNLQNIPIRHSDGLALRRAFVAKQGFCLLSADYSQIELRLLAHYADVPALKAAFADGVDVHKRTAAHIFGVAEKNVDKAMRRRAKAINFGIIYGISAFGLARQLKIETHEAQQAIDSFFQVYGGVRDYMDAQIKACRRDGYVSTLFGRRCFMPAIKEKNTARRHFAERAAINAPIQGSAADLMKRAMIQIDKALNQDAAVCHMILQVHDELLFEVQQEHVEAYAERITAIMEHAHEPVVSLSIDLVVDVGWGQHWGEAH